MVIKQVVVYHFFLPFSIKKFSKIVLIKNCKEYCPYFLKIMQYFRKSSVHVSSRATFENSYSSGLVSVACARRPHIKFQIPKADFSFPPCRYIFNNPVPERNNRSQTVRVNRLYHNSNFVRMGIRHKYGQYKNLKNFFKIFILFQKST